jgi:hypothetical protein
MILVCDEASTVESIVGSVVTMVVLDNTNWSKGCRFHATLVR